MPYKFRLGTKFAVLLGIIVAVSITVIFYWLYISSKNSLLEHLDARSRALLQQIIIMRQWIADQGGLYIKKGSGVESHSLLFHLDMKDTKGMSYAFKNPAMVTRELSEYSEKARSYRLHLTSLKLKNPANVPSDFERYAMLVFKRSGFDKNRDGMGQVVEGRGKSEYIRIVPLKIESSCLGCHADQGYKEGDIGGVISVAIPMDDTIRAIHVSKKFLIFSGITFIVIILGTLYFVVWLLVLKPVNHLQAAAQKFDAREHVFLPQLTTGDEFEDLSRVFRDMLERINKAYEGAVKTLAYAIGARDAYTKEHVDRVVKYCVAIAKEMGFKGEQLKAVEMGAVLHDVGKIGVSDAVLLKPGKLTEEERTDIKKHTKIGTSIVYGSDFLLREIPAVLYHHERYDGTGYPEKLKGDNIPIIARIISVADAFDSMTSNRPYREAMDSKTAFAELQKGSGTQFDPEVVKAFEKVFWKEFSEIRNVDMETA